MNIRQYLLDRNIPFFEKGKNIMREHIGLQCFKCDDPSHHLNIKIDGSHALCFRCGLHLYGVRNIIELLEERHLSNKEFIRLLNRYKSDVILENRNDFNDTKKLKTNSDLDKLIETFKSVLEYKNSKYYEYLVHRGLTNEVIKLFDLSIGNDKWKYCVIIPIKNETGKVVSFTGRLIVESKVGLRYINAPNDLAYESGASLLFGLYENKQLIKKVNYFVLTEGVFDVMRLRVINIPGVALLRKMITDKQLNKLINNFSKDVKIFLILDKDVTEQELIKLKNRLSQFFNHVFVISFNKFLSSDFYLKIKGKDCGDMTDTELKKLRRILNET